MSTNYRFPFRGLQIDLARQMENPSVIRKIAEFGASLGYNALVLYGEGALEYRGHPECNTANALPQAECRALAARCQALGMELIPVIPALGHATYLLQSTGRQALDEHRRARPMVLDTPGNDLCVSAPATYELLEALISEYCQLPGGRHLHLGGDESWNFATCPECREAAAAKGRGPLLAEHFNRLNAIVKKHGRKTMLWGDMLAYYPDCVERLDKDIVVCDWFYKPLEHDYEASIYNWRQIPTLENLRNAKLETVACPRSDLNFWSEAKNLRTLSDHGERHGARGFLNTVWELKPVPYVLCYPSLAYGAACCVRGEPPEPGAFLQRFLSQHFRGVPSTAGMAVAVLGELGRRNPGLPVAARIRYHDGLAELALADRCVAAAEIFATMEPITELGEDYRRAALLLLGRAGTYCRCEGAVNALASARRRGQSRPAMAMTLREIIARIPELIQAEQAEWARTRPQNQPCPAVEHLLQLRQELELFPQAPLPDVLLLDMINNDCSLQKLTMSVAAADGDYTLVGSKLCGGPFGRDVVSFTVPADTATVRITISGLGQLLLNYLRVLGPNGEKIPAAINAWSGHVVHPENLLRPDLRPAIIGDYDSESYFVKGEQQPESFIEVTLKPKATP